VEGGTSNQRTRASAYLVTKPKDRATKKKISTIIQNSSNEKNSVNAVGGFFSVLPFKVAFPVQQRIHGLRFKPSTQTYQGNR